MASRTARKCSAGPVGTVLIVVPIVSVRSSGTRGPRSSQDMASNSNLAPDPFPEKGWLQHFLRFAARGADISATAAVDDWVENVGAAQLSIDGQRVKKKGDMAQAWLPTDGQASRRGNLPKASTKWQS